MEILIGILVVVVLVSAIADALAPHWPTIQALLFGAAGLAFIAWLISMAAKAKKEQEEENRRNEATRQAERDKERALRLLREKQRNEAVTQIKATLVAAKETMRAIPKHLSDSENFVSQAAKKLGDRSFYPFWDNVAEAVARLALYRKSIEELNRHHKDYERQIAEYRAMPSSDANAVFAPFPVTKTALPSLQNGAVTAERINALYDGAHRDFEFSNIYANWKTNQSIVVGFDNLSRGIDGIRDDLLGINMALESGFSNVEAAIGRSANTISSAINEQSEVLNSIQDSSMRELVEHNRSARIERSTNEAEMIDLLDNIQRKRERIPGLNESFKLLGTRKVT